MNEPPAESDPKPAAETPLAPIAVGAEAPAPSSDAGPLPSASRDEPAKPAAVASPRNPAARGKVHKRWEPKPAEPISRRVILIIAAGTFAIMVLLGAILWDLSQPIPIPLKIKMAEKEFKDKPDNFRMQYPEGWKLEDRLPDSSIKIQGPREEGYIPEIVVWLQIAPGRMESFMKEHKGRVQAESEDLKWLKEEDDFIDGCLTTRLEFEWTSTDEKTGEKARVRSVRYIVMDNKPPRFYVITGSVETSRFERYIRYFDATARTFKRTNIPEVKVPKFILEKEKP